MLPAFSTTPFFIFIIVMVNFCWIIPIYEPFLDLLLLSVSSFDYQSTFYSFINFILFGLYAIDCIYIYIYLDRRDYKYLFLENGLPLLPDNSVEKKEGYSV